jgi:ribose transport system permease protein
MSTRDSLNTSMEREPGIEPDRAASASARTRRVQVMRRVEASVLPAGLVLVYLAFALAEPATYPTVSNLATMLASQAVLVLVTLGLLLPLTAGDYDLSVGAMVGLSAMIIAVLNVQHGWPVGWALLAALAAGLCLGAINSFFTIVVGIESLIVTLGSGTLIQGLTLWISGSNTVSGVSQDLVNPTIVYRFLRVPLEFYFALVVAIIMWYVFEYTPLGRRLLITGRGPVVARLTGIRVNRIRAGSFLLSGLISALAGVLYAGTSGAAAPTGGSEFLLPAFAAAFLGATTIYPGRFNPIGSLIAVYFLVFGVTGLEFIGAPDYVQDLFYGAALIAAVAFSQIVRRKEGKARSGR